MKNSTLMNFRSCNFVVAETGVKEDFNRAYSSNEFQSPLKNTSKEKSKLSGFLMLALLFLFTNFLFAQQQPACNLSGLLVSQRSIDGGPNFTINSEVVRSVPGTIYKWDFKSNDSDARFVTTNGQPSITLRPGDKNGNFNIKLTVINPPNSNGVSKKCSCTKSVSIGNF